MGGRDCLLGIDVGLALWACRISSGDETFECFGLTVLTCGSD